MCVETSVSVFVVLELDDRVLPMLREDVKRCARAVVMHIWSDSHRKIGGSDSLR